MSNERQPFANIPRVGRRCNQLDVKEMLKAEMESQIGNALVPASSDSGSSTAVPKNATKVIGFEDFELYFDSVERDPSNSDYLHGILSWQVKPLNNNLDVNNVVEMMLGDFYIPKVKFFAGEPPGVGTYPDEFYFRRIYMEFIEAPANHAVLGPSGNRFHWEFDVQNISGQSLRLVPTKRSFFFPRPLQNITNFRIRFMIPNTVRPFPMTAPGTSRFDVVPLPEETVTIRLVLDTGTGQGYDPPRFEILGGPQTNILGPWGSTGTPGIAAFITGFDDGGVSLEDINDPGGVFITNIIDNYVFELENKVYELFTSLTPSATMFIPKNRIAFPVRFSTVTGVATNYVSLNETSVG